MKTVTKSLLALALAASSVLSLSSFNNNSESISDTKQAFVADWERAKAFSLEYIDAMPADGIKYRPSEDVRSFAEQFLHLSQGNVGLVANATGAERIYASVNLEKEEKFHNKEALRAVVSEVYDWVIDAVENWDMANADEMNGPNANFQFSRMEWLKKAFEHQTHHRGQTTIYLRMKGIAPPPEKLF